MGQKFASKVESTFDKYWYYENSVQNTESDIEFINEKFEEIYGDQPRKLREDFCGTGMLMCDWVKQGKNYRAVGIDNDPEPIEYGKTNHLSKLNSSEKDRVQYIEGDVLDSKKVNGVDVVTAFNFSYLCFQERETLLNYFKEVRASLGDKGVFFMDLLGGPECQTEMEEKTKHEGYTYFWECESFNPINNEVIYNINFKRKGEKKRRKVFSYRWRLWSLPELRDLLKDAGFGNTIAYWEDEDDDDDEEGNGEFYATEHAENCDAWVTYIAATP
jgi:SAM-dependent methyltransferase